MFGYVRIYKPLLRFCEYDAYKAVYCSICKELGRSYGLHARLLLNFDFTFVALLYLAMHRQTVTIERKRCVCNPLKKCNYCACCNDDDREAFRLTSAMTVEMFYYKLVDNIADSGPVASLGWKLLRAVAAPMRRKAAARYPQMDEIIGRCMELQQQAESNPDCSLDEAAHPSAQMLSELAALLTDNEDERIVLRDFGYYFGRWIYLIDAFDDLADDVCDGSFNVFARRFELTKQDAKDNSERLSEARLYANECLNMTVARSLKAFDLLPVDAYKSIFDNILLHGLGESQRIALHEKELHTT